MASSQGVAGSTVARKAYQWPSVGSIGIGAGVLGGEGGIFQQFQGMASVRNSRSRSSIYRRLVLHTLPVGARTFGARLHPPARAARASATRLEGPSRSAASVLPKGLISVAEKERVTSRPPTSEDRQRAVNTTASPSVPAERTSPQSRARMPA